MMNHEFVPYEKRLEWFQSHIGEGCRILEIGPSHNPIASRRLGYDTTIVDAFTQEELVNKYQTLNIDTQYIEAVDYVWRGETLSELLQGEALFDIIIASHVIEHIPNPLGFLQACQSLLNDTGQLLLAIPDMRRCFDALRIPSSPGQILEAYFKNHKVHTLASIYDFNAAFCMKNGLASWFSDTVDLNQLSLNNEPQVALQMFKHAFDHLDLYVDVHGWTFTPASFLLILKELDALNLIPLNLVEFAVSEGHEFYAALAKNTEQSNLLEGYDRLTLYHSTRLMD